MTVHKLPPKRPNIALMLHQQREALHGTSAGGIEQVDPTTIPDQLAAWLPAMAKSITEKFDSIAAAPNVEAVELACEQLHGVIVTLTWLSAGLRKAGKLMPPAEPGLEE